MNPTKLKHDAIIEVVFEFRFSCDELPEIVIGRLADREEWKDFHKIKLPLADIPASIRQGDPNIKYDAVLQLSNKPGDRLVRVGSNSISYHLTHKYHGWAALKDELVSLVDWFYSLFENLSIERLGLRYIDALRSDLHTIDGLSSLNLSILIGNNPVEKNVTLHFTEAVSENHIMTTRITSGDLVQGQLPKETSVITDIDIYTQSNNGLSGKDSVKAWVDEAHQYSKDAFFRLIPREILKNLVEA